MLEKFNKIKTWQVVLVITFIGFASHFTSLTNPFIGDDAPQIVSNVPVHSISNIKLFFEGGTFYDGQGLKPLTGFYYRPLATTTYSLLYSIFGSHTFYFHLIQLLLCIGSTVILYLFFKFSFKPVLALFLSLVFLLHPIGSQVAFEIANMPDALFFFFGMSALYLLFRFKSVRSLIFVAICLFLSLLSKETGLLFVLMALLYLFWFNRKRLSSFITIIILPVALWLLLKVNAVGLDAHSNNAPIDSLNLYGRLLTAPSIVLFYITKFLFPFKLASAYYWTDPHFSISHFLLPLFIDLVVVALVVYTAILIYRKATKPKFYSFLFFAVWTALGLLLLLQIIPLDFTASEAWFYFPMVGVLGMIGTVISTLTKSTFSHFDRRIVFAAACIILAVLGFRTAFRGTDYRSQYILARHDIANSTDNYIAYNDVAIYYFDHGEIARAKPYAVRSVAIYPYATNELTLGGVLGGLGDYAGAYFALTNGLKYQRYQPIYDDLAVISLYYGNPNTDKNILQQGVKYFPTDANLWLHLAVLEDASNDNADARVAITNADNYGEDNQTLYNDIMNNDSFTLSLGQGKSIRIHKSYF